MLQTKWRFQYFLFSIFFYHTCKKKELFVRHGITVRELLPNKNKERHWDYFYYQHKLEWVLALLAVLTNIFPVKKKFDDSVKFNCFMNVKFWSVKINPPIHSLNYKQRSTKTTKTLRILDEECEFDQYNT